MKTIKYFLFLFNIFSIVLVLSCSSKEPALVSNPIIQTTNRFYNGDGGKGKSLAILVPRATGLAENQGYLPTLVQGEFVSNFSGYSAISVLDRVHLDEQYTELLSGYYDDDAKAGMDLGHLTPTDYIMGGSITKTSTGYALQISITKTADKMTTASYSGTCTFNELDNLTGIRRASLDLLQKMGVTPTDLTKTELAGAAAENHVSAQTALAHGITAQQQGSTVAALTYYSEAAGFKAGIGEADQRLSSLSQQIESGNIAQNIRNDIQRREAWKNLLEEAADFYNQHPIFDIVVNPTPTQGRTDYNKGTVELVYNMFLAPNAGFKSLFTILMAYWDTGKAYDWQLGEIIKKIINPTDMITSTNYAIVIDVNADLIDENGKIIAQGKAGSSGYAADSIYYRSNTYYPAFIVNGGYSQGGYPNSRTPNWPMPWAAFDSLGPLKTRELVFNVDVNLLSDNMTLKCNGLYLWYSQFVNDTGSLHSANFITSEKTLERYFVSDRNFRNGWYCFK